MTQEPSTTDTVQRSPDVAECTGLGFTQISATVDLLVEHAWQQGLVK